MLGTRRTMRAWELFDAIYQMEIGGSMHMSGKVSESHFNAQRRQKSR